MLYDPKWKRRGHQLTDAEVFNAAADALETHGHSIGKIEDDQGRMCLWGAIGYALTGDAVAGSSGKRSWDLLTRLIPLTDGMSPVTWNNRPGRTQAEVVSLLRKAAATT